jgi:hypothetical protein
VCVVPIVQGYDDCVVEREGGDREDGTNLCCWVPVTYSCFSFNVVLSPPFIPLED